MVDTTFSDAMAPQHMAASYLKINQERAYVELSALVLLLVHIIATLPIEIERMWMARQSRMSVLFYIIRYLPPLCASLGLWIHLSYSLQHLGNFCIIWSWFNVMFCTMLPEVLAEILMVMRVWALYHFGRRMLTFLILILIGRTAIGLWSVIQITRSFVQAPWARDAAPVPGCPMTFVHDDSNSPQRHVIIICVSNMLTTGLIFMCMLSQCLARSSQDRPFRGTWRDLFGIRTAYPVMHILIRDGCLYFLMIICAEVFFLIAATDKSSPVPSFSLAIIQVVYSIPATRLVLHLRDCSHSQNRHGQQAGHLALGHVSSINFAARNTYPSEFERSEFAS